MVLLWVRAAKRVYAPGGAGYGQVQSHFEQTQLKFARYYLCNARKKGLGYGELG